MNYIATPCTVTHHLTKVSGVVEHFLVKYEARFVAVNKFSFARFVLLKQSIVAAERMTVAGCRCEGC